jgi:hypothetical protein
LQAFFHARAYKKQAVFAVTITSLAVRLLSRRQNAQILNDFRHLRVFHASVTHFSGSTFDIAFDGGPVSQSAALGRTGKRLVIREWELVP